jgi:hypothetical protein
VIDRAFECPFFYTFEEVVEFLFSGQVRVRLSWKFERSFRVFSGKLSVTSGAENSPLWSRIMALHVECQQIFPVLGDGVR